MGAGHYDIDSDSQVLDNSNNSSLESTSIGTPTNTNSELSAGGVDSDNSVGADSDNLADADLNNLDCSGLQDPLDHLLAGDQQQHICHPPIPVSDSGCPFASDNTYTAFCACLCKVCEKHIIPHHYGVSQQEWMGGLYGKVEEISYGCAGQKVDVALPFAIWWPHMVEWTQGLDVMTQLVLRKQGEL